MKQNGEAEDNQQLSSSLAVCTSSLRDTDSNLNGLSVSCSRFSLWESMKKEWMQRMLLYFPRNWEETADLN